MNRAWIIVATCLALTASVLLLLRRFDAAFVVGALGILAWFIDVRVRLGVEKRLREGSAGQALNRSGDQYED